MLLRAITSVYSSGGDRGGVGLGHEQQNSGACTCTCTCTCTCVRVSLQGEAEATYMACMHGNLEKMAGPLVW